jgi:hypothetical protein
MPIKPEAQDNQDSRHTESDPNQDSQAAGGLLGFSGSRQAPLAQEVPDADSKMERSSHKSDNKQRQINGIPHVRSNV